MADALAHVANGTAFAGKSGRHDIYRDLTWQLAGRDARDVEPEAMGAAFGPWLDAEGILDREPDVVRAFRDAGSEARWEGEAKPGRPIIMVGGFAETTDKAIASLSRDPVLWQRNGELVRLVRVGADVYEPRERRARPTRGHAANDGG